MRKGRRRRRRRRDRDRERERDDDDDDDDDDEGREKDEEFICMLAIATCNIHNLSPLTSSPYSPLRFAANFRSLVD